MFGFPEKDRDKDFQYQRNFLRSVILRVDYSRNKNIVDNKDFFKKAFGESFPNSNDIVDAQGVLRFENKTPIFEPQSSSEQGVELKTKDLQKILKITDTFIAYTISGSAYVNFETAFSVIKQAFESIQNNGVVIENVNRTAIRKTNVIDFTIAERATIIDAISSMFNNLLNKSILELPDNRTISSYNQAVVYNESPYKLNLNYGYRQGADTNNWNAVVDIDIFNEEPLEGFELSQIEEGFSKINKAVFDVFHWSLQDSLISELNKQ